ncbi:MAG: DUF58 domain-containing protein [Egibacteraceae bacterium]
MRVLAPRGLTLTVGGVLLWAAGRLLGVTELHIAAVTSVTLVALGGLVAALSNATVSARRTITTTRLAHGATGEVVLELRNDARLPSSPLLVEDDCHYALLDHQSGDRPRFVLRRLSPGRVVTLRYPIVGSARGRYEIGPLRVHVRDPFGLAEWTRSDTASGQVLVYPPIETLPPTAISGHHHSSGSTRQRRLFSTGDEFHTLREYVEGDDLRQVHWPSTAHRQTLMVRQHEQPWQPQATLLLDARRAAHTGSGADSTLEKAVSVAASLVTHLAGRGYTLRLVTESSTRHAAPSEDRERLLDRLAALQASTVPGLTPAIERARGGAGLLLAVLPPPPGPDSITGHPDIRALLRAGRPYTGRIGVVIAGNGHDRRATELAAILTAAGWTTTTLAPGQTLAERWPRQRMGR